MVTVGDKVEIDGVVVTIEAVWAQGKYTRYNFTNGEYTFDLHKLVESGKATVVPKEEPKRKERWPLPKRDEDL